MMLLAAPYGLPMVCSADSSAFPKPAYLSAPLQPSGQLHFFSSRVEGQGGEAPRRALVVLHGHGRDAGRTFAAAYRAAVLAGRVDQTLIVAPLFQVAVEASSHCRSVGLPAVQAGDALWSCASWMEGGRAENGGPGAFSALDTLLKTLKQRWPSVRQVTLAGFSAGGQMLQHYIGFAAPPPGGLQVRYVVADPGSWLYFDDVRPRPVRQGQPVDWLSCQDETDRPGGCAYVWAPAAACPGFDRWKYGLSGLPSALAAPGRAPREVYASADIAYLEGALDQGEAPAAHGKVLDRACAAFAQGSFRLQRGLAYAAYDRERIAPDKRRRVQRVPGCAHDVACVFTSLEGRAALFLAP
ncbi:hypothetical protein [Pseudomonas sp. RIT-PI-AD]|uniref:hypothetical protein n=1 Tax=Pseudomonas sp. RIT-PI-AD TaxID=3035294 RepID=UPI0021DAD391|nr:hypothetical protein [Pseudomonas sp. RIT-PI-AD]